MFFLVLVGTYIGMGALVHGIGLSAWWLALSTVLVWAAPAQVIMISAFGSGATMLEVALAVTLTGMRLFPMAVALLPLLRGEGRGMRNLLMPTHFTSISTWVEALRLLPPMDRHWRLAFFNGMSVAYMGTSVVFGFVGYYLAAGLLPPLLAGVLLFLTPMSFFMSTVHNARMLVDRLALVLGLILGPVLAYWPVDLDLMWTALSAARLPIWSIGSARPHNESRYRRVGPLFDAGRGRLSAERDLARARPGDGARAR
ncbi:MAG: AzlC family ABC transporter permease [Pseudolabrys sp.]